MENKPMRLLIVEDNEVQCNAFREYISKRDDVCIVGMTNSSSKALEYVKTSNPEGVILDIELHKGQGSGIEFLTHLKEYLNDFKPIIIVTTNSPSDILYENLHEQGVDLIFYKHQKDYCVDLVVSTLVSLRKSLYKYKGISDKNAVIAKETEADFDKRISDKINAELETIGISSHLKGKRYLFEAIYYLIKQDNDSETVFNHLSNMYKRSSSSISRVMQTAINYAWRTSSPEELETYYTAKINYHTGVPSTTEFIYYYADKIKNII